MKFTNFFYCMGNLMNVIIFYLQQMVELKIIITPRFYSSFGNFSDRGHI